MNDPQEALLARSPVLALASLRRPWLVADFGGTNARMGWVADGSDEVQHVATLRGGDHPGDACRAGRGHPSGGRV